MMSHRSNAFALRTSRDVLKMKPIVKHNLRRIVLERAGSIIIVSLCVIHAILSMKVAAGSHPANVATSSLRPSKTITAHIHALSR